MGCEILMLFHCLCMVSESVNRETFDVTKLNLYCSLSMILNQTINRTFISILLVFLGVLFSCSQKSETEETNGADFKKPDSENISGMYFFHLTGDANLAAIGWDPSNFTDWPDRVKFLGKNFVSDAGVGTFGCMKFDMNTSLINIYLPIEKETFTYPFRSQLEINPSKPNEVLQKISMQTPSQEIQFIVDVQNQISFPFGRIWRKEKYNGKELKSVEDCKDFPIKILDTCLVQRQKGEYFISEKNGSDIRKELTQESEIIAHLPLNAKVKTEEFKTNWNQTEVSWKKIKFDGGEGYIDSIHLEKNPSHCYPPNMTAKRKLKEIAEWGGGYFESNRIIHVNVDENGSLRFDISPIEWEDQSKIEKFVFGKDSLVLTVHEVRVFEGEVTSDYYFTTEIPYSRFHLLTPWNRIVEYEQNSTIQKK